MSKSDIDYLIDNYDALELLPTKDRFEVSRYIEQLRLWGAYNMLMTDLSPFLTDGKYNLEHHFSSDILNRGKETGDYNTDSFFEDQEGPVKYLWDNAQEIRDIFTRAALRFVHDNKKDVDDMDNINKVFKEIAKKLYPVLLRSPYWQKVSKQ